MALRVMIDLNNINSNFFTNLATELIFIAETLKKYVKELEDLSRFLFFSLPLNIN